MVTQTPYDRTSSSEKLDLLLKKIAVLEDVILMGGNVYKKEFKKQMPTALLQAKMTIEKSEIAAGEIFILEIEIANVGQAAAALDGIEEMVPCCGLELMKVPSASHLEGLYLDLGGKVVEPSMIEKLRFKMRALEKGTYAIAPRIVYMDGVGRRRILEIKLSVVKVEEVVLPSRISTGYKDLDNLLYGGIPEKYAVALTSISCDETKLLVNRFLENGAREGGAILLITVEAYRWEKLAEEYGNFHLFVCNPQAEIAMKTLPNVVKLRGVENLTDVGIPLFSTLRKLEASDTKPRRICIEILSDILLQHHAVQTRRWLIGVITELKSRGFTTLALINPHMHPIEEVQAVLDLFDGEIEVYEEKSQKFLRINRMYGQNYIRNELPLKKERLTTIGTARKLKYHSY